MLAELVGQSQPQLAPFRQQYAALTAPGGAVQLIRWERLEQVVSVSSPREALLVFGILAFPGMEVTVSGKPVRSFPEPRTGLLAVPVTFGFQRAR